MRMFNSVFESPTGRRPARAIESKPRSCVTLLEMVLVCAITLVTTDRAQAADSRSFAAVSASAAERLIESGVAALPTS